MIDPGKDPVRAIRQLLCERGVEAEHADIQEFLSSTAVRWYQHYGETVNATGIAKAIIDGNKVLTMCLHLRFGDALFHE